ncbi:RcnB family protein [Tianweitania sp. BSSL-BM11]|uniref:RcnB family protein n=1 Tax=Tianweitania aestuarii TaxID=2814886 RepID=A0ABS5RZT6_9HYPH|nr:RcnB family protein [Tianweitania aestuarii]MBS9722548.1 RcnB family protein [Tianweitania aestuarii]
MSKFFTRLVLSTAAVAMLAVPMAQAQSRHDTRQGHHYSQKKHHDAKRHNWKRGERVSDWRKRAAIRDYRRHGLRAPNRGQHWVKVDNHYLLITLATGIVASIATAR